MWLFLAASVFFPLINSGWSDPGPLPEPLLNPPSSPCRIPDGRLQEQASLYRTMRDPEVRSRIALTFRQADNPAALPVLQDLLKKETDPRVQADLITSYRILAETQGDDVSELIAKFPRTFLLSKSAVVRREAALILIQAGTGLSEIAVMLEKNESSFVTASVLERLAASSLRLPAKTVGALAASQDPQIRNSALKYLARTSANPDSEKLLANAWTKAQKEKDIPVLFALTDGLAANPVKKCPALLEKLVLFEHLPASARVAAASAMSPADPVRVDLLLLLLNDSSAAVRTAAARSLSGAAPSEKRTKALGKRLRDESLPVREAAAASLAAKTEPVLSEAVLAASDDRRSLGPLLTVIRATGNREYAARVAEILKTARKDKDAALICQAVETLTVLRAESLVPLILDCAADKNESVRAEVAASLRVFPGSATTSVLKKLLQDPSDDVVIAALESVRILNDTSLVKDLVGSVGAFKRSAYLRAYACRALGKMTTLLDATDLRTIRKMVLFPCIVEPMSPPMYDDPLPRGLGLYLLLEGSRAGNPLCQKAFDKAMDQLENPTPREKEEGLCDGLMAEYVRQIAAFRDGKEVEPKALESVEPELAVFENKKNK